MTVVEERESNIPLYAIPLAEFQTPFRETPLPYSFPQQVTRANFRGFLTDVFAKAQGRPMATRAYFAWLALNQGFDYKQTLGNFLDAGGVSCLSPQEQQAILKVFRRVPEHQAKVGSVLLLDAEWVSGRINSVLMLLIQTKGSLPLTLLPEDMRGMPWHSFLKKLSGYVATAKRDAA